MPSGTIRTLKIYRVLVRQNGIPGFFGFFWVFLGFFGFFWVFLPSGAEFLSYKDKGRCRAKWNSGFFWVFFEFFRVFSSFFEFFRVFLGFRGPGGVPRVRGGYPGVRPGVEYSRGGVPRGTQIGRAHV